MKKLLLLLALVPTLLFSQGSWIHIQLMTDNYPSETSWNITPPGGSPIIIENDSNMLPNTLYDTIVQLGGTIVASIYDQFGDGLGSSQWGGTDGWFMISNSCQDTLMYVAGNFGDSLVQTLTVAPCAPPTIGCLDPNGLDYDSTAYFPGPCTYPTCGGLLSDTVQQTCLPTGQTLVQFFWQNDTTNGNCNPVRFWYWNEEGVGPFQYGLAPNQQDFAVYAGNGQMPPNWSVEHYGMIEFADSTFSDTIAYTPTSCIAGCTDPTQPTYNPWATFDDGSCSGTSCDTNTTYQVTMEITFDNWPSETGWSMTSGTYGILQQELAGAYNFNDIGQTYTYNFCVDQIAGFELIVTDTYGDGMAGSTSGGSLDGMIVLYDCLGDTIWYMDNPGFGNTLYSGVQYGVPCLSVPAVYGCMDDDYQEYDPLATVDDSSCTNLHIYGCTDTAAFNYDPNATILDLVPDCNYQLWIGDAGGDGWGNSYIGVYQNGINFGTFTMGPGSYQDSFLLVLDPGIPVDVYYFEVGGPQQPPEEVQFQTWHNSFKLTNADGVVLMHEGTNPFANNGQGALQSFASPFWVKYSGIPFCGDYCIPKVYGCMDSLSFNYDPLANTNDNSCIPFIFGCINNLAFNYDSTANMDDGSCIPISYGCTDTSADNYNSLANTDDGSCYYIGCTDTSALNYDPTATVNNGCVYPIYGCTDPTSFNYDPLANVDDSSCVPVIFGCMDATAFNYDATANTDNNSCIPIVNGCTNPLSFNYNPLANTDNGSCIPVVYGCTDSTSFNYNPLANTDNGSCVSFIYGCTDTLAINYNPLANTNDGSCIAQLLGCTDSNSLNYNPLANTDDGSCIPFIYGCTDPTSFNYSSLANTDDGSCIPVVLGCTDPTSFNYNAAANVDDSSCVPFVYGCMDATAFNYDPLANTDNGSCVPVVFGCTDSTSFNYDPLANTDNGSCIPFVYGCTDNTALNYDPLANTLDNSCCYIGGCTDPTSVNYDPNACYDDGSCITAILGCTDVSAYNYNPAANVSDSTSCLYDAGCYGGPGIPYWLNDGCYAWVIDVDNYCCDNDWDANCQSMYDYCQDGWPVGIDEASALGIHIYPNPTKDVLNIDTRLDIGLELYDMTGKLLINKSNPTRLDLSKLPNGIYNMSILYKDVRYSKRVVKQ